MATTQTLKKKLNGTRSICKVTKALKTASTVKFSKLSALCGNYRKYCERYHALYADSAALFDAAMPKGDPTAPVCYIVMAGNKGMCGGFNTDLYNFASEEIEKSNGCRVIAVGKWLSERFEADGVECLSFVFGDIPEYGETAELYAEIKSLTEKGEISRVELIYPEYRNMMRQKPRRSALSERREDEKNRPEPLFFPDRESVVGMMADKVMTAFLHEKVLECAMGAQAATLMTMRSAYDTATEYAQKLESDINRIRQSRVTADVIETSSELSMEVD